MTTFHPTNEAYMCSVIDNNIVMWDVGESGVKIVCNAVLDGKGMTFCILLGGKNIVKITYTYIYLIIYWLY